MKVHSKTSIQALFLILILILSACEGISVKGSDGTKYNSYQDACAALDFDAAHAYINKMQTSGNLLKDNANEEKDLNNAKEYVFKQESLYLMGVGDSLAKRRLLFLLMEDNNRDQHCAMLIDLAMQDDDVDFTKTLANQYSTNVEEENLNKLFEYLKKKEGNECKDYILNLFQKLGQNRLVLDAALYFDDISLIKEKSSLLRLSDSESINLIASKRNKSLSEIVLSLLTDQEEYIDSRPTLGITSYYWAQDKRNFISECESYERSIRSYNEECQKVMEYGIKNKNRYLANRAISKMKINGTHTELPEKNEYYRIKFSIDDGSQKRIARRILNDATARGAFK